jgi:hypothetical protein
MLQTGAGGAQTTLSRANFFNLQSLAASASNGVRLVSCIDPGFNLRFIHPSIFH